MPTDHLKGEQWWSVLCDSLSDQGEIDALKEAERGILRLPLVKCGTASRM